jgi:hypothetical protein
MFDADIQAQLQLMNTERGVEVRAFVTSAAPKSLRWRLIVESRSSGGSSNVSQGGATDGGGLAPVSAVTVSRGSQGAATLVVYDGDQEVAREVRPLDVTTP